MKKIIDILIFSIVFVSLLVSCTEKRKSGIDVGSPFHFVYDPSIKGTEFVAINGEDKITRSQLLSPSPALTELEQRINLLILNKVYSMAKAGDNIVFSFDGSELDLKKILGAIYNDKITVTFDSQLKSGVAKINDKIIDEQSVAQNDVLLMRLMQSYFEQSIKALEGLYSRRKVLEASKVENTTMESFIKEKITKSQLQVSDKDLQDFINRNNISSDDLTDAFKQQIKDTIVSTKREKLINEYVAKHLIKDAIRVSFNKPLMKVSLPAVIEGTPHLGEGPISILLFSRWDCESCAKLASGVVDFVGTQEKYFKLNYLFNFPVNSNEERMVSEASLCLQKQGESYFWSFASHFNAKSAETVEESVNQAVKDSGADFETFRSCFLAREFKAQVDAHLEGTKDLGFYKSPVLVLDGQVMEQPDIQQFVDTAMNLKVEKGLGFNWLYKIKQFFK